MSFFFKNAGDLESAVKKLQAVIESVEKKIGDQDREIASLKDKISNLNMALAFKSGKKPPEAQR